MKVIYLFLVSICLFSMDFALYGQQSPQYSLYFFNPLQFNPAYAGMEESLSLTGVFRKQWVNLNGSPSQQSFSAHAPFLFLNSGFGLQVDNETLGARRYSAAILSYDYQLLLGKAGVLSLGMGLGITQLAWDGSRLRTPEGNYNGAFDHMDGVLPENSQSSTVPNLNLGVFFKGKRLGLGLSTTNNLEPVMDIGEAQLRTARHYHLYGDYRIELGSALEMVPSLLLKTDLTELQSEVSVSFWYNGNIFGGSSYRGFQKASQDAVVVYAGMKLNSQTILGYAYDLSISPLANSQNGSHEIVLNYRLKKNIGKGKLPKIIFNPRFL